MGDADGDGALLGRTNSYLAALEAIKALQRDVQDAHTEVLRLAAIPEANRGDNYDFDLRVATTHHETARKALEDKLSEQDNADEPDNPGAVTMVFGGVTVTSFGTNLIDLLDQNKSEETLYIFALVIASVAFFLLISGIIVSSFAHLYDIEKRKGRRVHIVKLAWAAAFGALAIVLDIAVTTLQLDD